MGGIRSFRDLEVYQRAHALSGRIYNLTLKFPEFERYELGRQLRNSSRSIPANIAEGHGRRAYEKDFKRFLSESLGSCNETQVHLDHARDCGYVSEQEHKNLMSECGEIGKMLTTLIKRWHSAT